MELDRQGVTHASFCETWLYKSRGLSCRRWIWEAGPEVQPGPEHRRAPRGMGTLTRRGCKAAVVHSSDNLMVSRLEVGHGDLPLYIVECHFPRSTDTTGHKELWGRIREVVKDYEEFGHIVLMGDFNAHTRANGDKTEDTAGRRLRKEVAGMGLQVANFMAACEGTHSFTAGTTIDYVCISQSLIRRVKKVKLGPFIGSDHKLVTLRLAGMEAEAHSPTDVREVWRTENLPSDPESTKSFVGTFQAIMDDWIRQTGSHVAAMEAIDIEAQRIADIVEWSFQAALDKGSSRTLGTKVIGPKATPMLNSAMKLLNNQRELCEKNLKQVMASGTSTSAERAQAVSLYRSAKKALFQATWRRKDALDQESFRQMEEKQADSKLFWNRGKKVTSRMKASISPPPMAMNEDGLVESDPVEVLKIWRRYSAQVADMTPAEEGIYDDEHRDQVEARLEGLRRLNIHQPELDHDITREEVFRAIRKMKMGKAPGVDGVLSSILRHAADAVGTNDLKEDNSLIDALTLMFNYVFRNEVWPERWGSGIIFPLYKQDSRLEPENYRPITLLSVIGKTFGLVIEKRISDWSENNGVISDEQGGFRRARGTPDQIFLLREIISSRKERGLPTLVTYIDARKAYDTVWREGNYVRLFDAGMQGKMWRQIQAMGANMKSRVRLSVGDTKWHKVNRGVAQGAVESPWLYSCFIDGMTEELKRRGLGIMFEGVRVPLLMYADDIVMLASTVTELRQMNEVATSYAFKHRFRHNGEKSAVMAFNADARLMERVDGEIWRLSGERVLVKTKYKYLGVDILNNTMDWKPHIKRLIGKAHSRSQDLIWMCKRDGGLRPRSAATLWKAMVRPILEYAAELWAGDIPKVLVTKAEKVQTDFARVILGLQGHRAVSGDLVRAELGLEQLEARWEKLRLGYWRRIQVAGEDRILTKVARRRIDDVKWGTGKRGSLSWMRGTRDLLRSRDLGAHWGDPRLTRAREKSSWKERVYRQVEGHFDRERRTRMVGMSTLGRYLGIKHWDTMDRERAQFTGEIGKRGALVVERYLDDTKDKLGRQLKLLCRADCLPLMARVAWEMDIPDESGKCMMCDSGESEDIAHFILHCHAYRTHRARLHRDVSLALMQSDSYSDTLTNDEDKLRVLLGARVGSKHVEDSIDHAIKRFLNKAWKARRKVTSAINKEFGRRDIEWAKGEIRPCPHSAPPTRVEREHAVEIKEHAVVNQEQPLARAAEPARGEGARKRLSF